MNDEYERNIASTPQSTDEDENQEKLPSPPHSIEPRYPTNPNLDILDTLEEPAKVGLNYLAQLHQMNIPYQILKQETNDGSEPRYLLVVQAVNQLPDPINVVN